jgi:hypothetical protein
MMSEEGSWITINGTHILLKGGESPKEAINRKFGGSGGSGGSSSTSKGKSNKSSEKIGSSEGGNKSFSTKNAEDDDRYSPQEKASIERYRSISGSEYTAVNTAAREGKTHPLMKDLDSAIDKSSPIPKGTEIYRGLSEKQAAGLMNAKVGDSFKQGGYQSYSLDYKVADNFSGLTKGKTWSKTILRVEGNGSLKGVHIGAKEAEVLLGRGLTYTVTGRSTQRVKGTKIKANIITVKVG